MNTIVPPTGTVSNGACGAPAKAAPASVPPSSNAPGDGVAATNRLPALLTIGAVTAAQLVPGVVEGEGLAGVASAAAIGVRAATANPAVAAFAGASSAALGHYALSLAHDATASTQPFKAIGDAGKALDASIRASLGIPPSGSP
jgi:hypothetical protein